MKQQYPFFTNVLHYLFWIFVGIVLTVVMLFMELPQLLVYTSITLLCLIVFAWRPMYIIYRSKNIEAIDRYVRRNHYKAVFQYPYALAYGGKTEVIAAIQHVLHKYKHPEMRAIYEANLAILENDADRVLQIAKQIKKEDYRTYYVGASYVMKKDTERVQEAIHMLNTPWMKHSLQASLALQQQEEGLFSKEAAQAVEHALGIQRYTLYHYFQQLKNQNRKAIEKGM